jgi:succinate dehydrogenase / fumarate reductase iron-sulfur subunit
MSSKRTVNFKIYRYDPDKDDKPYMQDISVELEESDKKLLDALVRLKAKDDSCPSVARAVKACVVPTP